MRKINRRKFLAGSAAIGAGILVAPYSRVLGANDDIRVAVIGFRSKGAGHVRSFSRMDGVRLVALCDADQNVIDREVKKIEKDGGKVKTTQDMRRIFDDKEIDAIVTATPNHWHALCTVWACQAGKDVYVEKPVSHDIWEGRKAVEAARKYNRIVQAGTQNRSDTALAEAVEWIQAGNLGKVLRARGFCYKHRGSIGKTSGPQPPPDGVDYDLWCGPAPKKPLRRRRLHYDWHWFWHTGNADIGNQGIHQMDICRWFLGEPALAPRVMGYGGRFGYDDDAETPNTEVVFLDYERAPLIFEVRGLPRSKDERGMDHYKNIRIGEVIDCEGGYFAGGWVYDNDGKRIRQFTRSGGGSHARNFIKAVRSRKLEDNPADILEGHLSSALCHMGNVSYRLGKEVPQGQAEETFRSDKVAQEIWDRFQQHVTANETDPAKWQPTVGPWLTMDTKTERFAGPFADRANVLAKGTEDGKYRPPFVVPEQV